MPTARIPMKKIIEILRLKYEAQLSHDKIARACQLSKGAVYKYVHLAKAKGITWPLADDVDEAALEALLFPAQEKPQRYVPPDCFQIHQELKRKGVTLQLLWAEYVARYETQAYRYSRFCACTASGGISRSVACASCTRPARRRSSTTVAPLSR
ncbi:hypothetical protein [Thiolapillus sp.]|uniref:hypothetical protein n=2 Tax=Thiolapillus sp. TaxID=2017437 RepID=UPI0025ECFAF8|nr:hypothetical protein [Thiolapillus sp.]